GARGGGRGQGHRHMLRLLVAGSDRRREPIVQHLMLGSERSPIGSTVDPVLRFDHKSRHGTLRQSGTAACSGVAGQPDHRNPHGSKLALRQPDASRKILDGALCLVEFLEESILSVPQRGAAAAAAELGIGAKPRDLLNGSLPATWTADRPIVVVFEHASRAPRHCRLTPPCRPFADDITRIAERRSALAGAPPTG